MENISLEAFECEEFTVDCTVPLYWNDDDVWAEGSEGDQWTETTSVKGIFEEPYLRVDLGEAGQDGAQPALKFPTALVPHAVEGDTVIVAREVPDSSGTIQISNTTYIVATVRPDGYGVTDCLLYQEE